MYADTINQEKKKRKEKKKTYDDTPTAFNNVSSSSGLGLIGDTYRRRTGGLSFFLQYLLG